MGIMQWLSTNDNWINLTIIAVYMIAVVGIGFFFNDKNKDTENYLLGGRNMPWLAVALSVMMTLLSSISLVVVPGEIYNHGLSLYFLGLFATLLYPVYYLLFVRFYFKLGSFTPYEYLERRYDPTVRTIVVISAFYGRIIYLGMVLFTTSKIFEGAYGWPGWVTILVVGVVGSVYTIMGGMKAVIWTDVIQFFVLAVGVVVILVLLNNNIDGGIIGGISYALENGRGISEYSNEEFYTITPYIRLCFWFLLWSAVVGGIGSMSSDQFTIQRLLATKDWKTGFKSQCFSTFLSIVEILTLWVIGFCVYAYFQQQPVPDPIMASQERPGDLAFFRFIALEAPMPIPGLFMAAMLAAIMSTLDSGMNSMATIWLKEFHCRFINKNATDEQQLKISKWATLIVGVFAILFALAIMGSGDWLKQTTSEVGVIFGFLGACTLPAFLFAVCSRRANAVLIWIYTVFATGEAITKICWYTASRNACQAWKADPSVGMGWAGPLPLWCLLTPLVIGLVLVSPAFIKGMWKKLGVKISVYTGVFILGCAFYLAIWYTYSNLLITDTPKECSFAFAPPFSFIIAFIVLWFCPVQPEKKWRGLTIATVNDGVIKE